jgi:hypothetical protein
MSSYPAILDEAKVGEYPASAHAGGGFVWDEVLEYRVWCYPRAGATGSPDGNDYYFAFATYDEALAYSQKTPGAQGVLALILQREYLDEPEGGVYVHVKSERVTEWPAEFLSRPRRTEQTIPDFFAPDAPANRLDILRGRATR